MSPALQLEANINKELALNIGHRIKRGAAGRRGLASIGLERWDFAPSGFSSKGPRKERVKPAQEGFNSMVGANPVYGYRADRKILNNWGAIS